MLKKGTKLNAAERARIDEVARVRRDNDWQEVIDEGFPRLAR
jgi:hypothetical protein